MDISVKLSKDFERCLDDLKKKYGEDFEKLNGLHASQLDFSEFIDNFVDKETVADASIDSSSNVHNKEATREDACIQQNLLRDEENVWIEDRQKVARRRVE